MPENLTDVDNLLLERWTDTIGIWDAIKELEDRLADRLEAVAERLRPWLEKLGFGRLPGDFRFRLFGREWFIPLTSTVVLSLIAMGVSKLL